MQKYDIRYAFTKSLPVMFGYVFLGTAFGIVANTAGISLPWAFGASVIVFAGSMQFVLVPLLVSGASLLTVIVTTLFVNSRHMFYGLSFIESFNKMKTKPYMIFALSDETYSVLCSCRNDDPDEKKRDSWFLIALFDQCYWITGTIIGSILGKALPVDFTGIDFSMTALFVVIIIEQILNNRRAALPAAVSGLGAGSLCLLLFGADSFLLPALIITVFAVSIYASAVLKQPEGGAEHE